MSALTLERYLTRTQRPHRGGATRLLRCLPSQPKQPCMAFGSFIAAPLQATSTHTPRPHCARPRGTVTRPLVPPRKAGLSAGCCVRAAIAPDRRARARACAILSCDSKHRLAPTACPACCAPAAHRTRPFGAEGSRTPGRWIGAGSRARSRCRLRGHTTESQSHRPAGNKYSCFDRITLWNEGPQLPSPARTRKARGITPIPHLAHRHATPPPPPPHPCGWAKEREAGRRAEANGGRACAQLRALPGVCCCTGGHVGSLSHLSHPHHAPDPLGPPESGGTRERGGAWGVQTEMKDLDSFPRKLPL